MFAKNVIQKIYVFGGYCDILLPNSVEYDQHDGEQRFSLDKALMHQAIATRWVHRTHVSTVLLYLRHFFGVLFLSRLSVCLFVCLLEG